MNENNNETQSVITAHLLMNSKPIPEIRRSKIPMTSNPKILTVIITELAIAKLLNKSGKKKIIM
jgi:hypothetical protein